MTRFLSTLAFALVLSVPALAEDMVLKAGDSDADKIKAPVTVAVELLGSAVAYSLQTSFRYADFGAFNLGFSVVPAESKGTSGVGLIIPISHSFLIGRGSHNLDLSAGALIITASVGSYSGTGVVPHTSVGYRYSPRDGGFFARVTVNQFIGMSDPIHYFWPGVAIGGTF
jgi:hypothetical protein